MKAVPYRLLAASLAALVLLAGSFSRTSAADDQEKPGKPTLNKPQHPAPKEPEPQDDQGVIKLGTDLVLLDVTVVDQSNKPVMDLSKENFQVFEDKQPQKI